MLEVVYYVCDINSMIILVLKSFCSFTRNFAVLTTANSTKTDLMSFISQYTLFFSKFMIFL